VAQQLSYKGMDVVIEYENDDHAKVKIGERDFSMTRHPGGPLRMWACDEAYFMSDDLVSVIRHLIDYWYIIDSPDTAPFECPHHGELPTPPGGVVSAHPPVAGEHGGHAGHGAGGGAKKRTSGRSRRR
jgi:hypothetical protein